MKKLRIILADDHRVVVEGLRSLLEPHFDVVGIVPDGRELLTAAKTLEPDVVVLDISMPSVNGIDAARQLQAENCRAKVIFLTMHKDATYAELALDAGAAGFVLKHSAANELIIAINEAFNGGTYITPQIAGSLFGRSRRKNPRQVKASGALSSRQRQVLKLVAEGCSAKEIAAALCISRRTAEFHKANLIKVLSVRNSAELVRHAIRSAEISG
jgi:DNA-binding NarL/FixJ family response regulator